MKEKVQKKKKKKEGTGILNAFFLMAVLAVWSEKSVQPNH